MGGISGCRAGQLQSNITCNSSATAIAPQCVHTPLTLQILCYAVTLAHSSDTCIQTTSTASSCGLQNGVGQASVCGIPSCCEPVQTQGVFLEWSAAFVRPSKHHLLDTLYLTVETLVWSTDPFNSPGSLVSARSATFSKFLLGFAQPSHY